MRWSPDAAISAEDMRRRRGSRTARNTLRMWETPSGRLGVGAAQVSGEW
jgi:hypothetical protein